MNLYMKSLLAHPLRQGISLQIKLKIWSPLAAVVYLLGYLGDLRGGEGGGDRHGQRFGPVAGLLLHGHWRKKSKSSVNATKKERA